MTIHSPGFPGWCGPALVLLAVLAGASGSRAQTNTGTAYNTGSTYQGSAFANAGTFTNASSGAMYYAGPSAATFTNTGTYAAAATATDQFIGPGGAAGAQELAGNTAPSFYNLTLANGAGRVFSITNAAGVNVANALTLSNGKTTTPATVAGAIRLASAAPAVAGTLGAAAGYVDGYLAKAGTSSFSYPLGATNSNATSPNDPTPNGGTVYAPITLSSPGGTALRYVAAPAPSNRAFTAGDAQPLKTVSAREYYQLGTPGAPSGSTISLPYGNFGPSRYVGNPGTLTIAAFNSVSGRWENLSNTATNPFGGSQITVTLNKALTATYTALALASTTSTNPLPVTLVAFTAVKQGAHGLLSWQTATEQQSASFELQVSVDGAVTFQALTTLAAAGTSTTARYYSYLDADIARYGVPLLYYRLRQLDLDGTESYSSVVALTPNALPWTVTAYPNPYETELTAQLTTTEAGPVHLTLLDAAGHLVLQRELAAVPGSQVIVLDEARRLASGTYTLLVRQHGHVGTVRIVHR